MHDSEHHHRYKDRWYGKYRAFCRDNNDPERLGRIRMEVPAVLGTGHENWSDWAAPCFPYGGTPDSGMFLVPEEEATVWAEFEGGNPQFPIWSGVWLAGSNPGEQPQEAARLCNNPTCLDCEDKIDHAGHPSDGPEHRKFHGHPPYYCPRRRVVFKSETGHTIMADDRDQEESLKIIDRGGQMLHMTTPVKRIVQTGNRLARGERNVEDENQLDIDRDVHQKRARIELTDLCRQSLRFEAWADEEKIHLISCDKTRTRWQQIVLDTTKNKEKVRIMGLRGLQNITIDSSKGQEKIVIRDRAGSAIIMDGLTGNLVLRAASKLIMG